MQGSNQAYEHKTQVDETISIRFKKIILEQTESFEKTPAADLFRVQLLSLMLNRFDEYTANGADADSASAYVIREFSNIRERMIEEGFVDAQSRQKEAFLWPKLSDEDAMQYVKESSAAMRKRARGIALCSGCVAPLMLITGVDTLMMGYTGNVSNLLGLCAMFGMIAAGVYDIVTAKNPQRDEKIQKKRFSLSEQLKKKLTDMKERADEKARRRSGRGIALLVLSVLPIFLGAALDELWFKWTNDAFAMLGVGGMAMLVGVGVHELVSAGAEKKAVSTLLKE